MRAKINDAIMEYDPFNKVSIKANIDDILDEINYNDIALTTRGTPLYKGGEAPRWKCCNVFMTLDTETSSISDKTKDNKILPIAGFPVMIQFCINYKIYYCRLLSTYLKFLDRLDERLKEENVHMQIWVHNLSYDAYYILSEIARYFNVVSDQLGDKTSLFKVSYDNNLNFEFHCSYKLFDKKLEKLAEEWNCAFTKTKDWDYTKFRTPYTPLDDEEIHYGCLDVYILYEVIDKKCKYNNKDLDICYGNVWKLPCSKTGEVRYYQRNVLGKLPKYYECFNDACIEYGNSNKKIIRCSTKKEAELLKTADYFYWNHTVYKINKGKPNAKSKKVKINKVITVNEADINTTRKLRYACRKFDKIYKMEQSEYQGGFTHANKKYLGRFLNNVKSFDLTSAYPSVILVKRFVLEYNKECTFRNDIHDIWHMSPYYKKRNYGYIMKVKFTNLRTKYNISTLSYSKCESIIWDKNNKIKYSQDNMDTSHEYIDNGRILKCHECVMTISDIDYDNINMMYEYDDMYIEEAFAGLYTNLPTTVIIATAKFYEAKSKLKKIKKDIENHVEKKDGLYTEEDLIKAEQDLKYAKQLLNSIYGVTAMDYWKYEEDDYNEEDGFIKFSEDLKNKRLPYSFAIAGQITAYVRQQIFNAILKIGPDSFVYADTDSIKFLISKCSNYEKIFDKINHKMKRELGKALAKYNDEFKHCGIDLNNWSELPNQFDDDGTYKHFKTLGAKRYIVIKEVIDKKTGKCNEKFECTCAGVPKKDLAKELQRFGNNAKDWFKAFNKGLTVVDTSKKMSMYVAGDEEDGIRKVWKSGKWITMNENLRNYTGYDSYYFRWFKGVNYIVLSNINEDVIIPFYNFILIEPTMFSIKKFSDDVNYQVFNLMEAVKYE